MVIDRQRRFIFVHVYKTGGSSITDVLGGRAPRHVAAKHAGFNELPEWRHNYFAFGFVRNPWDRVVSSYKYLTEHRHYHATFEDFVKEFAIPSGKKGYRLPQHDAGKLRQDVVVDGCSYVGRFEHLQKDFCEACGLIGIPPAALPHKNKSTHRPYQMMYTDELRNIVANACINDIGYFGFEFDSTATQNVGVRR